MSQRNVELLIGRLLTDDDLRAIRAVYAAGLRAGAARTQFVQAGLINP